MRRTFFLSLILGVILLLSSLFFLDSTRAHPPLQVTITPTVFNFLPLVVRNWSAPPATPSDLAATPVSQTQIDLSWTDNSDNEDGFQIERSPSGSGDWTQIATVGTNTTTYSDTGLSCTIYYYRIRAYNTGGHSAYSNLANATPALCIPTSIKFTEDFSTIIYQDAANTTADWDTADEKLKLHSSILASKVGSLPSERAYTSAIYASSSNKAYIFGGYDGNLLDDIVEYDLTTGAVTVLEAKLPTPRNDTSAIYVPSSNKAYIFGGYGEAPLDDIVEYDLTTGAVTVLEAKLPTPRYWTSAIYAPSSNKAYIFGGHKGNADRLNDIVEYDLMTGAVTVLEAKLPTSRSWTSAIYVLSSNRAYVFGGYDGSSLDDIVEYDLTTGAVTVLEAKLPTPRDRTSAIYVPSSNKAYIFGGYGRAFLNDIVEYDLATGTVTVLEAKLPESRELTSAIYAPSGDKAYVFGGAVSGVPRFDDIVEVHLSHYGSQEQAQSLNINSGIYEVLTATLTVSQTLHGQAVDYYLSNNGGTDWEAITPGIESIFSTIGADLRWKAVLSSDGSDTPIVDGLTITYWPNPHTPIPAAPILYSIANEDTDGSYQVTWNAVDRAAHYVLVQGTDSTFTDAIVVYTDSHTSTRVVGRAPGAYYYRVQAVSAAGSSGWSNIEQVNVTKCLNVPVLAEIENDDGNNSYIVNWGEVATVITYTLQEDTDAAFTNPIPYVVNTTSKSITGQGIGTYYYRVKAANEVCGSDWSNTQAVTVTIEAPVPEPGTWYGNTSWFEPVQFRVSSDSSSVRDLQFTLHDNCGVVTSAGPVPIENGHFSFGGFWGDFTATDEASGNYTFAGDTPNCGFVLETGSWNASH